MKLLIATTNKSKFERYKLLLSQFMDAEISSLLDYGVIDNVEEDGANGAENAHKKALAYMQELCIPTLAIDEELYLDFLPADRQPGMNVRRVNGKRLSDDEMIGHYGRLIDNALPEKRKGCFIHNICLVLPNGESFHARWKHDGLYFRTSPPGPRLQGYPFAYFVYDKNSGKSRAEFSDDDWIRNDAELIEVLRKLFIRAF
ncbi:hypothetical protein JW968_04620 [Candidatus Woesearchaeota archaeon]|nr:hypothetical protein [Candidatus Woesearchaeota archaeon]